VATLGLRGSGGKKQLGGGGWAEKATIRGKNGTGLCFLESDSAKDNKK